MTDNINAPAYYIMPDGTETLSLSRWLTSNGGQAVQYIARSTRSDGVFKGDRVEDLKKSIAFIQNEIDRLSPTADNWVDSETHVDGWGNPLSNVRQWDRIDKVPRDIAVRDKSDLLWCHDEHNGWHNGGVPYHWAASMPPYTEVL